MTGITDWFTVFRSGDHRASDGRQISVTNADLDEMVGEYDGEHPSPCVITHDTGKYPLAYAQVGEIRRDGDRLQAKCNADTIHPQFQNWLEGGALYNRSIQLLAKDGEDLSKGYRMGHVAFLGAHLPAVSGMDPLQFDENVVSIAFNSEEAWDDVHDKRMMARMLSALKVIGDKVFGADSLDNPVSTWEVESAHEDVGAAVERASSYSTAMGFNMNKPKTEINVGDDAAAAAAAELKTAQDAAAASEATAKAAVDKLAEFEKAAKEKATLDALSLATERVSGLVKDGRITPAQATGLAEFAASLPAETTFEFSREEGATPAPAVPGEFLFSMLGKMPVQINMGEPTGDDTKVDKAIQNAAGDSNTLLAAAQKHQKAEFEENGRKISIHLAINEMAEIAKSANDQIK